MDTVVENILGRVGKAVLLPIPANEKGPRLAGWQNVTLAAMSDPSYLARFEGGGNIGV